MNDKKEYASMDYETVLRKYADDITRICMVNTGNPEDAKDIFQNVFLKLYLSEKEFTDENHLKAWLIRVAVNECKDLHKASWKQRVDLGYGGISEEHLGVVEEWRLDDECEKVLMTLRKLPEKYRQIIYLYYCEEYRTAEIADMLHMRVNTVKSRLKRGRKILGERMENENEF